MLGVKPATDRDQDLAGAGTGAGINLFWPGPGFGRDRNLAGTGGRDRAERVGMPVLIKLAY